MRCRSWMVLLLFTTTHGPAGAQTEIVTPDVDLLARTIREEIEVIRWHMGRPPEIRDPIPVVGVSIRENFRQSMSLWRKVNQLGVELVGGGEPTPVITLAQGAEYGPGHVYLVLESALDRLTEIRDGTDIVAAAGILGDTPTPERDPGADPSDVFRTIVQSNRQVNRMLERGAQPGDVYQQVQQAIFFSTDILSALDDPNAFPPPPEYQPGLRPQHVYGRLLLVFDRLAVAFEALGLRMVGWEGGAYEVDDSTSPSDVFDLATLLLSELEYLHARVPGVGIPLSAEHPGRRWPSDVYQQAGILTQQAARIMQHARQNPNLLGSLNFR